MSIITHIACISDMFNKNSGSFGNRIFIEKNARKILCLTKGERRCAMRKIAVICSILILSVVYVQPVQSAPVYINQINTGIETV